MYSPVQQEGFLELKKICEENKRSLEGLKDIVITPRKYNTFGNKNLNKSYEIYSEAGQTERLRKLFRNTSIRVNVLERCGVEAKAKPKDEQNGVGRKEESLNNQDLLGKKATGPVLGNISPEIINRRNIIRVQNRIANLGDRTFITATRVFLKEGEFYKYKSHEKVVFFLFDDLLVVAKASHRSRIEGMPMVTKFRKALEIRYLDVQAVPDTPRGQNLLKLRYNKPRKNQQKKKWARKFAAESRDVRDQWFYELSTLREKLRK
jgi:hypothetical protein